VSVGPLDRSRHHLRGERLQALGADRRYLLREQPRGVLGQRLCPAKRAGRPPRGRAVAAEVAGRGRRSLQLVGASGGPLARSGGPSRRVVDVDEDHGDGGISAARGAAYRLRAFLVASVTIVATIRPAPVRSHASPAISATCRQRFASSCVSGAAASASSSSRRRSLSPSPSCSSASSRFSIRQMRAFRLTHGHGVPQVRQNWSGRAGRLRDWRCSRSAQ
jgi:hypothetical protein